MTEHHQLDIYECIRVAETGSDGMPTADELNTIVMIYDWFEVPLPLLLDLVEQQHARLSKTPTEQTIPGVGDA